MRMPTSTILPNVRYASSFLDKKYKKYAELGEVVMDKITGEILLKRKIDGKLISFVQNDKYLHDLMVELRILMKNNTSFTYPTTETSWFISSDFNIVDINSGSITNVLTTGDIEFANTSLDEKYRFEFYVSKDCNGFFIRPISRDTDKNIIEYLTNYYNQSFQNYNGGDSTFLEEKAKFSNPTFASSNVELTYSILVSGTNSAGSATQQTFSSSANIRVNEETFVAFPNNYTVPFSTITSIRVTISKLTFHKFDMAVAYMEAVSANMETYDKLVPPDDSIVIENVNIMEFVDNAENIPANDNIVNIALLDGQFVMNYVGRVDKLAGSAGFIPSIARPTDDLWTINNAWGEMVRIVHQGGLSASTDHETDLDALEDYIYSTEGISTNFTFDENSMDDIYIQDVSE